MRYLNSALRICGITVLLACSDSSGPEGTGHVSILLKDAPGDVLEAVVTIDQIYLVGGESDSTSEAADSTAEDSDSTETEEGERENLLDAPVTVDLLTLADLLANGQVTPVIDRTPLGKAADALRYVGAGHTRGKVVVTV